jgi:hypothetical protein
LLCRFREHRVISRATVSREFLYPIGAAYTTDFFSLHRKERAENLTPTEARDRKTVEGQFDKSIVEFNDKNTGDCETRRPLGIK